MKTILRSGETIIKEGKANLQRNIETVGGHLFLTNKRLVFESHYFNIQIGATEIELSNIKYTRKCWTKLLGFIPIFPNSLSVYTKDGAKFCLVLFGREDWAATIEAKKKNSKKPICPESKNVMREYEYECSECYTDVREEDKICPKCGANLE